MKRNVWFVSPLIYALLLIILLICLTGTAFSGIKLIVMQWTIALITIAAIVWRTSNVKRDVRRCLEQLTHLLAKHDDEALEAFPMPAVAFSKKDEILWYNSLFGNNILSGEDMVGGKVSNLFKGLKKKDFKAKNQIEVSYGTKKFTMYISTALIEGTAGYVAYFIDNTAYKATKTEYASSRPVAIVVLFDNKEEILNIAKENDRVRIRAAVEDVISNWISDTSGFIKKLDNGRFLIMIEERHVRLMIERKFAILDEARKIMADERNFVTLSIGVGRGAETFKESENWANQALDMCLGRGGDQAAIKSPEGYVFFGGISKTVEKRSKVRARVVGNAFAELVHNSENVYVMGHSFSDLDSVGACIGIHTLVKSMEKTCRIVINRSTTLAEQLVKPYMETAGKKAFISVEDALEQDIRKSLLVIVDTHSPDFVESPEFYRMFNNVVVIDHHRKMVNHIDNTVIFFHEPYASSACEMVAEMIQCISENCIGRIEAEALLAGVMLDTKNFVLRTGVRTFEAAAYLRRRGAETVEVKRIFSDSMDTYIEKSQLVSTAEIYENCAISVADEYYENIRIASSQAADELLTIQGIDASFVMFPADGAICISARSLGKVNVQLIMEELGGGGHATMAGAQVRDADINEVRVKIIGILKKNVSNAETPK